MIFTDHQKQVNRPSMNGDRRSETEADCLNFRTLICALSGLVYSGFDFGTLGGQCG